MELDEMDEAGLDGVLRGEPRAVLVDFWSPWCAPCRSLRPHLRTLADEYRADARVVAVNLEAQPQLRERYQVTVLPTLILFKDGTARHRFTGPTLPAALAAGIQETCTRQAPPAGAGQPPGGAWVPGSVAPWSSADPRPLAPESRGRGRISAPPASSAASGTWNCARHRPSRTGRLPARTPPSAPGEHPGSSLGCISETRDRSGYSFLFFRTDRCVAQAAATV